MSRGNDVDVAGSYTDEAHIYKACYWKNGTMVKLPINEQWSEANTITLFQGDVYVAGSTAAGQYQKAVLWKNGVPIQVTLSTDKNFSAAIAVFVK